MRISHQADADFARLGVGGASLSGPEFSSRGLVGISMALGHLPDLTNRAPDDLQEDEQLSALGY